VSLRASKTHDCNQKGRISGGRRVGAGGMWSIGTGMEETYQLTSALKHLPFGKHVGLVTDARFSGVSTGACLAMLAPRRWRAGRLVNCATATSSASWLIARALKEHRLRR